MNFPRFVLILLFAAPLVVGCEFGKSRPADDSTPSPAETTSGANIASTPLPAAGGEHATLFERLPVERTGVDFTNPIDNSHPMRCLFASSMGCGGVAVGDVDADGRPDLYLTSGPDANKLYRQVDDLRFEDVTATAGVDGGGAWSTGASLADVDGDGDLDIYVCNYDSPNLLYINQGNGRFSEQAAAWGVDFVDAGHMPAFCDYDLDGDLDFYLMTNFYWDPRGVPKSPIVAMKDGRPEVLPEFQKFYHIDRNMPGRTSGKISVNQVGQPDHLLRNNGDGTFSDVSQRAGIGGVGKGNSATWWDYNADGRPDLYVGNDFENPDRLYHNNGDGTFSERIVSMVPHTSWFSMGADSADLNGDGLVDFVIADMSGTNHYKQKTSMGAMADNAQFLKTAIPRQYMRNAVYLNSGGGRFREAAHMTHLANSNWTWTVRLADLDNDGRVDVFFTNGMARDLNAFDAPLEDGPRPGETSWDTHLRVGTEPLRERNLAFRNLGDLTFQDVSRDWGLDHLGMSYAAVAADLDRDGDLDLVVANLDEPVGIYRNHTNGTHRVLVRLTGTLSNSQGIGSTVRIQSPGGKQVRFVTLSRGYLASNEPLVHFGLGRDERIEQLSVHWPSGHVQRFENLQADRLYTITEPGGSPPKREAASPAPMFRPSEALAGVKHREQPYDDFKRQPLLPNQYSQLGPGMAWGDIDADGDDDLWIGGAKGQPGQLCRNDGDGKFSFASFGAWFEDRLCEDMGGVWLDAEGDGDLDLYVVSGGVECKPGAEALRDRLYLNDGEGNFTKAPPDALPDVRDSGGVVAAADFDRDGDLDLFVGGRIIPGKYPLAPASRLLRNDDGRFTDVTAEVAAELAQTGLVTAAVWSDADGDGLVDLLVAHEWGPIKLFHNDGGRLVDHTQQAGLSKRLGWWNGISGRDLDGDGDIDYVVTNFGLNTKYHASQQKPTLLYYGDFEKTGKLHLVEAEYENEHLYPVRGKSCSTHAMPHLGKKYTTFNAFALAELPEIYTPKCLGESQKFTCNTLESGVLTNDGKGRFSFAVLPRIAQIAPGFGCLLTDVNADGHTDLYFVQNFFGPQPETGRMAGGVSQLLLGRGDGTFQPVDPALSGLLVAGDAKSLTAADLNGDDRVDLVVGVNDAPMQAFLNQAGDASRPLTVRLKGKPGNPTAIGARVTVHLDDGRKQTAEVQAAAGYLSQSSSTLFFGHDKDRRVERIVVLWPDGIETTHSTGGGTRVNIARAEILR